MGFLQLLLCTLSLYFIFFSHCQTNSVFLWLLPVMIQSQFLPDGGAKETTLLLSMAQCQCPPKAFSPEPSQSQPTSQVRERLNVMSLLILNLPELLNYYWSSPPETVYSLIASSYLNTFINMDYSLRNWGKCWKKWWKSPWHLHLSGSAPNVHLQPLKSSCGHRQ